MLKSYNPLTEIDLSQWVIISVNNQLFKSQTAKYNKHHPKTVHSNHWPWNQYSRLELAVVVEKWPAAVPEQNSASDSHAYYLY